MFVSIDFRGSSRQFMGAFFDEGQLTVVSTGPTPQPGVTPAPAAGSSGIYVVQAGDSLGKISEKLYGDWSQWKRIFEANRDQISNPDLIHPGQTFIIPD